MGRHREISLVAKCLFLRAGINTSSVKLIQQGSNVNTYVTKYKGKKLVLKIYPKTEKQEIQELITLLHKINSRGKITIDPINSLVLSYKNYVGFVYPFFEGKHFRVVKLLSKLYIFGRIVADFDVKVGKIKTSRLDVGEARKERVECIPDANALSLLLSAKNDSYSKKVAKLLDSGIQLVENEKADLSKCRICVLHLDIHYDNVIYNQRTRRYQIIDVKEIRSGYLPEEITVVISDLIGFSAARNREIIKELLQGYESKIKLRNDEKRLIPFFMLLRKMGELSWLFSRYKDGKLPKPLFMRYFKISARYLAIVINQYDELQRVFSEKK